MIQLRPGNPIKSENLIHAREVILRASRGDGDESRRPDLIMLPVGPSHSFLASATRCSLLILYLDQDAD